MSSAFAKEKDTVITKFVPQVVTYNTLPDPKQYEEGVERGIMVKSEKVWIFQFPTEPDTTVGINHWRCRSRNGSCLLTRGHGRQR